MTEPTDLPPLQASIEYLREAISLMPDGRLILVSCDPMVDADSLEVVKAYQGSQDGRRSLMIEIRRKLFYPRSP